jgi:hypothetical protein
MNSVGRLVQIDPDQADRVVGTGCDGEVSIGLYAFEMKLRVIVIGRVFDNPADARSAKPGRMAAFGLPIGMLLTLPSGFAGARRSRSSIRLELSPVSSRSSDQSSHRTDTVPPVSMPGYLSTAAS